MVINGDLPLVNEQKTMDKSPISMVIFSSKLSDYQRVLYTTDKNGSHRHGDLAEIKRADVDALLGSRMEGSTRFKRPSCSLNIGKIW